MSHENKLLVSIPQINTTDPVFRELFGNPDKPELSPVTNINDINKGALFNSIEWHLRYQDLASQCAELSKAEGYFLKLWAEFLGIERPVGMTDEEFVGYLIGYVLSNEPTIPKLGEVFPAPDFVVLRCDELGFATDHSASDLGLNIPGPGTKAVSGIITPDRGASYIVVDDMSRLTNLQLTEATRILAAGTAVFAGETNG
ncbi:hypothetical protein LFX25_20615 [Leptospira sp. FAT2]|uniref:hypothetical protein n=1 Tax=Leptospira sanjuanensis TaxID=2879643 RepID=UPI001EE86FC3|nr:hypothetical protein [Leptospira sanjuanensis]MCG6195649.1 hypothetical protein [Leptospira sanjuanensis]